MKKREGKEKRETHSIDSKAFAPLSNKDWMMARANEEFRGMFTLLRLFFKALSWSLSYSPSFMNTGWSNIL
jgi:hypothetical protein